MTSDGMPDPRLQAMFVGSTAPTTCLLAFSSCLSFGGFLAIYLPKETANKAMEEIHR